MSESDINVYEVVGGEPTFHRLVDGFYARVEADEFLRPMFPADLEEGKRAQYLFLMQFFGGPPQYAAERGHPRLRMRHAPFPIGREARDHWLSHMLASMDEVGIQEPARAIMHEYFERASLFMINVDLDMPDITGTSG